MIEGILLPITIAVIAINSAIGIKKTGTVGMGLLVLIVLLASFPFYIKLTGYFLKKFDKEIRKLDFLIRWLLKSLLSALAGAIVLALIFLAFLVFYPFAFIGGFLAIFFSLVALFLIGYNFRTG